MLIFNVALIPMMAMSIVACYSTQRITDKGAALRFAGIVAASGKPSSPEVHDVCKCQSNIDLLPFLLQIANVATAAAFMTWTSTLYTATTFVLYAVQIVVTIVALVTLHIKSKQYPKTSSKKVSAL